MVINQMQAPERRELIGRPPVETQTTVIDPNQVRLRQIREVNRQRQNFYGGASDIERRRSRELEIMRNPREETDRERNIRMGKPILSISSRSGRYVPIGIKSLRPALPALPVLPVSAILEESGKVISSGIDIKKYGLMALVGVAIYYFMV